MGAQKGTSAPPPFYSTTQVVTLTQNMPGKCGCNNALKKGDVVVDIQCYKAIADKKKHMVHKACSKNFGRNHTCPYCETPVQWPNQEPPSMKHKGPPAFIRRN